MDQYLIEHPPNMIFLSVPLPVKVGVNVLTRETARGLSTWKILVFGQIVVVEKNVYYCFRVLFLIFNMSPRFMNLIESYYKL